jgi:acetyltransferase-like isoleucine patch superfamily enzyme
MPIKDVKLGKNVNIPCPELVNLYDCEIGDDCLIGPFVEIQRGVKIGAGTRVQSHSFICTKVKIGKGVFIAHGVIFTNDRYPVHRKPEDWEEVIVEDNVVIGNNATILPCRIGENALIGAGSVVTKNVPANKIVVGNPAKIIGDRK